MGRRRRARAADLATLAEVTVRQMHAACDYYHRMTDGYAPWWAPESFIRDHVARRLFRDYGPNVTLEETVRDLRKYGRRSVRGRFPRDSGSGRLDLVLWNNSDTARAIIEFKRSLTVQRIRADVKRLKSLVRTGVTKYGLMAASCEVDYLEEGDDLIAEVEEELVVNVVAERWWTGSLSGEPDTKCKVLYVAFRV